MAVSISLSPAPGLFIGQTSVNVTMAASGYSTILASTTAQPTFAKNIAYDEFGNPFLSVVQDGKGNVFFDGGFPKYYNNTWSPTYTTFGAMTNQLKLLYNAMKWCAEGNVTPKSKILLFGDALVGEAYAVKDTGANGFVTCVTNVASLAGFSVTVADLSDFPVSSTMTASYLSQFSTIIFLSSSTIDWSNAPNRLSAASAANIASFRQQGGGVMVITDHNVFQTLANQVSRLFGCSFSGNVDRHPVSVDTLVATYGNHPLWANMTGDVYAGGSEGIVTIPVNTPFNPATGSLPLSGTGYQTIYLTVSDAAGTVTTYAYSYALNVPDPVTLTMPIITSYKFLDLPLEVTRLNNTDTTGNLLVGGQIIGSFSRLATGVTNKTYSYSYYKPILASNKETVEVSVSLAAPVVYNKVFPVTLTPVNITSVVPAKRWASMRKNEMAAVGPKGRFLKKLRAEQSLAFTGYSQADSLRAVNNYYSTTYRAATTRTAVIGGWADNGSSAIQNWGYDSRGGNYGSIDSTAAIFSNQVLRYFANYKDRPSGTSYFAVSFSRTDNATQVVGNFTGRRIQLMDFNGNIMFDQDVSSAAGATADTVNGSNTFQFTWVIPAPIMWTSGATWSIRVV